MCCYVVCKQYRYFSNKPETILKDKHVFSEVVEYKMSFHVLAISYALALNVAWQCAFLPVWNVATVPQACDTSTQWNPSKPNLLYTGIPFKPNIACGPKSTVTYINNSFKPEFPLNRTFCLVPRWSGLEGFHCICLVFRLVSLFFSSICSIHAILMVQQSHHYAWCHIISGYLLLVNDSRKEWSSNVQIGTLVSETCWGYTRWATVSSLIQ